MTPEERILERLQLGDLSAEKKQQYLDRLAETVASHLMLKSAQAFHELEISRLEYMIEQGQTAEIDKELKLKFGDSKELMTEIENEIVAEVSDYREQILDQASEQK